MASVSVKNLDLSFGDIKVLQNLNLEIDKGEFLVLLGSSGCGKSTLLNCIAGLLDITDGQIFISDRNVTWEQPKDRGIGMVFQSYALYPQMTVEGNLAFGLKNARVPKDEIEKRIARAAQLLHIEPLLKRKPAQLSGGQRQRVAIGRALVRDVDVFLFDEPLSNLDAKLRAELRVEIKRLHQRLENTTMIYVTHDQIEAMTLADRIAIMRAGAIQQLADPATIYNKPYNRYVAGFIGSPSINFIDGTIEVASDPVFKAGDTTIDLSRYAFSGNGPKPGAVTFGIRPEHIFMDKAATDEPFRADVEVDVVEPMGADTLVWSTLDGHELRFRVDGQTPLRKGDRVKVGFDPARASIFDAETEMRL
ncbi:ABC transporter ATP-binding protein [Chelativorans salis]|uniref:Sn-glycerol-3-phosphate ABC transporter ATP-binding protein UgpC n=1 Tax=Chelativorans salis TaxID=2978478 RepID=A0ABT2LJ23_9HYPH|nr:sn-glycerol-3-phosphate ABC transporter ATP-binding protein UgpC [Chelativorans sp. EGI FJ00035]MCT7373827.1 sn-glycerol-3-phosphate ABC transporter ATP-binding protein UgpC [Chelativorans sp. EGI FJ00035]